MTSLTLGVLHSWYNEGGGKAVLLIPGAGRLDGWGIHLITL